MRLNRTALKHALSIFLFMRIGTSLISAIALWLVRPPTTPDPILRPYYGVEPILGGCKELLLGVWQRFDTLWYLKIVERGYSPSDGSTVYFPLYPMLVKSLGIVSGNYLLAAIIISSLAYIGVLYYLYLLVARESEDKSALQTVIYFAIFPTAFFLLAAYTESLFILFVLASLYYAQRHRWWLAGTLGFLASLTRLQGVCLLFPLLYLYLRGRRINWRLLAVLIVPLGSAVFLLYQRLLFGQVSLVQTYQSYLYAQFVLPWDNILGAIQQILSPKGSFIDVLNLVVTLVFLAMTAVCFLRLPPEYGIYMATTITVLLLRRTSLQPLVSMSRYALTLFPAFIIWGRWGDRPWINRLILYPSLALFIYLCGQFAMWGWVA